MSLAPLASAKRWSGRSAPPSPGAIGRRHFGNYEQELRDQVIRYTAAVRVGANGCSLGSAGMYNDLTTSHAVEIVRRSVTMLAPGQPALWREDAVRLDTDSQPMAGCAEPCSATAASLRLRATPHAPHWCRGHQCRCSPRSPGRETSRGQVLDSCSPSKNRGPMSTRPGAGLVGVGRAARAAPGVQTVDGCGVFPCLRVGVRGFATVGSGPNGYPGVALRHVA